MAVKAFNKELYFTVGEKAYALEYLPEYKPVSKAFERSINLSKTISTIGTASRIISHKKI